MEDNDWLITYEEQTEGKRAYGQESLMTLGNGYLGWRGAPVWSTYSENHYPGLYVAGIFNRTHTIVEERDIENEDMVNLPNPQLIKIYINGLWVEFEKFTEKRQSRIDFKNGIQSDFYQVKLNEGNLFIKTRKYVDPIDFHCFAFEAELSCDFAGEMKLESLIDGQVLNQNVERYRAFESKEFHVTRIGKRSLTARTRTTGIDIVLFAKTKLMGQLLESTDRNEEERLIESGTIQFKANQIISFSKSMAVATSYEMENPSEYIEKISRNLDIEQIKSHNADYWEKLWQEADIQLESDDKDLQRMIRMNIFHIRQAAQAHANPNLDASVGSRGLTGEGYRGHIFWDEIFVLPYYASNEPETAKALLNYRIKRTMAAKENAKRDQEEGAMFPWQSASIGDEQSQFVHLNTVNNEWEPDNSRRQRHVSLAIVYNMWVYFQVTNDLSFFDEGAVELILETTKFWLNKAYLGKDGRYHIEGVMGPDEFHEAYPGKEGGIQDNAYTNIMLIWQLNWVKELLEKNIIDQQKISSEFLNKLDLVSQKLALEISKDGIIAQYAGYFDLKKVDFAMYEAKYGDIHRIDRLMKAQGISPDEYQVAKQADVLMLLYNLGESLTERLILQLGYELPQNWLQLNRDYYLARTVHGSTTSRPVFAGIDVTLGNLENALDFLKTAIGSDYHDIQGGTTAEGIHIGVMGETLEVIQNEFGGVNLLNETFEIAPHLPHHWTRLSFSQKFKGATLNIEISDKTIKLMTDQPIDVKIYGRSSKLEAHRTYEFPLH